MCSCGDRAPVSPWGERGLPPLGAFVEAPDLGRWVAAIEAEARAGGLHVERSLRVRDQGNVEYEVQALSGTDGLGRPTTATRVASPFGVILALGPARAGDRDTPPSELLETLPLPAGQSLALPRDLTGDGTLELVLRGPNGSISIVALSPHGSQELPSDLAFEPIQAVPAGKGFALSRAQTSKTPLPLRFREIASFERGRFRSDSAFARAWHAEQRDALRAAPENELAADRVARLLARAFHQGRAEDAKKALSALSEEQVPSDQQAAFTNARAELERLLAPRPAANLER